MSSLKRFIFDISDLITIGCFLLFTVLTTFNNVANASNHFKDRIQFCESRRTDYTDLYCRGYTGGYYDGLLAMEKEFGTSLPFCIGVGVTDIELTDGYIKEMKRQSEFEFDHFDNLSEPLFEYLTSYTCSKTDKLKYRVNSKPVFGKRFGENSFFEKSCELNDYRDNKIGLPCAGYLNGTLDAAMDYSIIYETPFIHCMGVSVPYVEFGTYIFANEISNKHIKPYDSLAEKVIDHLKNTGECNPKKLNSYSKYIGDFFSRLPWAKSIEDVEKSQPGIERKLKRTVFKSGYLDNTEGKIDSDDIYEFTYYYYIALHNNAELMMFYNAMENPRRFLEYLISITNFKIRYKGNCADQLFGLDNSASLEVFSNAINLLSNISVGVIEKQLPQHSSFVWIPSNSSPNILTKHYNNNKLSNPINQFENIEGNCDIQLQFYKNIMSLSKKKLATVLKELVRRNRMERTGMSMESIREHFKSILSN